MGTFQVVPADVDEEALTVPDPWKTAEGLALEKARAVHAAHPDALVIGGDTVVAVESGEGYRQLAKPAAEFDAREMLRILSGRGHLVITGISVIYKVQVTMSATTRVSFRHLSDEEIAAYVATGEPMDKAGAYAIQGGAKDFVEGIEGSLSNVIGLPLEVLGPMLEKALEA